MPSDEAVEHGKRLFRHELDHDTESMFWLLLYWAVGAHPEGKEEEPIDTGIWSGLSGSVETRTLLVGGGPISHATHSFYKPVGLLLTKLAAILTVDRLWVASSDPRSQLGYTTEAFQHLILEFLLSNQGQEFMMHKVASNRRYPNMMPENLGLALPSNWRMSVEEMDSSGMTQMVR